MGGEELLKKMAENANAMCSAGLLEPTAAVAMASTNQSLDRRGTRPIWERKTNCCQAMKAFNESDERDR